MSRILEENIIELISILLPFKMTSRLDTRRKQKIIEFRFLERAASIQKLGNVYGKVVLDWSVQ